MKFHLNSISKNGDNYSYEYHTDNKEKNFKSTLSYFALAGVIGSFKVVSDPERGWLFLFPFWILVFVLSKVFDWGIKKWVIPSKPVMLRFVTRYPHYVLTDIFWMLECTKQDFQLDRIISNASDEWGSELDINIGTLSAMKSDKGNFSREILNEAIDQQQELKEDWSSSSGLKYPDLGMPKR
jgi:hypothetical protein